MTISNHPLEAEELMAYLDGELLPEDAALVSSHLEHCRECQKLDAELQEVSEMLMTWQVEEEHQDLRQIADVLEEDSKKPSFSGAKPNLWLGRLAWAGGLAAVVLFILALSIPSLLRNKSAAERSLAQARAEAEHKGQPTITALDGLASVAKPSATPAPDTRSIASYTYDSINKLQKADTLNALQTADFQMEPDSPGKASVANGPMIIRTAELEVTTKEFEKARSSVEEILKRRHGYVGELNVNTPTGAARSLTGTLRVPANQLDAALSDIKGLGRTEKEIQGGEEVTQQYVDLQARLANAQHTEQRLTDILRERTGKLSDVLAVEMQISRVRGEIEQMEAQRKTMKNQVDFATLTVTVNEEYKEQLKGVPSSTGTQFRNAAVEGYRSLVDGIIAVLVWLLSVGPTLLVWAAILFFPARMAWKKLRPRFVNQANSN